MRIQSPLSNLCETLAQVKASAAQYKGTLQKNEAATRAVLIDPVLRALGWDTAKTYMVEVEKTLDQARADYALFDTNGKVQVIVEAKLLGGNLGQKPVLMSLIKHAFTFGLQDVFLTDGLIWQHFTNFQPGNFAPTKVIDLNVNDTVECAAYLVDRLDAAKFWPETQTIDILAQQVAQLESDVSTLQQQLAHITASAVGSITNRNSPAGRNAPPAFSYVPLNAVPNLTGKKPLAFRLPDGTEVQVSKWNDVLREACKFTMANAQSIPIPLSDKAGLKVDLLDVVPPPTGIAYTQEQHNGQAIYVRTNYSANDCVANAIHILSYLPIGNSKSAEVAF